MDNQIQSQNSANIYTQDQKIESEMPQLTSNVGYCKPLFGNIKGRAYGREDSLVLYSDRIVYNSASQKTQSIVIPLNSVKKVKQRMQELWIYTKEGKNYTFEFGDPSRQFVGAMTGGVIGMGVLAKGVEKSGIQEWFDALNKIGLTMDDHAANTPRGMVIMTIRMFFWVVTVFTAFMLIVAVFAAINGYDGGKPLVFAVELPILLLGIVALKLLPSGKRA